MLSLLPSSLPAFWSPTHTQRSPDRDRAPQDVDCCFGDGVVFSGLDGYDAAVHKIISQDNPDMTAYYFHSPSNRLIEKPKNRGANWVGYGGSGSGWLFLWADERIGGGGGRGGGGGSHGGGGGSHGELVTTAASQSAKGVYSYTAKSKPGQSGGDALDGHYFTFKTGGNPADVVDRFEARVDGNHITYYRNGPVGSRSRVDSASANQMETFEIRGNELHGHILFVFPLKGTVQPNGDINYSHGYTSRKEGGRQAFTDDDLDESQASSPLHVHVEARYGWAGELWRAALGSGRVGAAGLVIGAVGAEAALGAVAALVLLLAALDRLLGWNLLLRLRRIGLGLAIAPE